MKLRLKRADPFFFFHIPAGVGIRHAFSISVPMDQKAHSIAHLRDCGAGAKIPDRRREHILSSAKKRTKIVGFVSPVCQVAAAGTATDASLIYLEDELVIGAHIYIKMRLQLGDVDDLSKVEHDFISLRNTGSGDPLRFPEFVRMIRRNLCQHQMDAH